MDNPLSDFMITLGMYDIREFEKVLYEGRYIGPDTFTYGEDTLVARYPKDGGDGQDVEIYETWMPATFHTIVVKPGPNSIDEPLKGFTLHTGSSQRELAIAIAKAVSQGMLGLREENKQ